MGAAVGGGQEGEEEETRQAKEMAAARRRWETLVTYLHLSDGFLLFSFCLLYSTNAVQTSSELTARLGVAVLLASVFVV